MWRTSNIISSRNFEKKKRKKERLPFSLNHLGIHIQIQKNESSSYSRHIHFFHIVSSSYHHRLLHLSICIIERASERATRVIMVRETIRIIAVRFFFLPSSVSFLFRVVEPTRARSSFLKSPPPPRKRRSLTKMRTLF
mgnify:CR=1 FL=1